MYNNKYYLLWLLIWFLIVFLIERYVYQPTSVLIWFVGLILIALVVIIGWIPIYNKYLIKEVG